MTQEKIFNKIRISEKIFICYVGGGVAVGGGVPADMHKVPDPSRC